MPEDIDNLTTGHFFLHAKGPEKYLKGLESLTALIADSPSILKALQTVINCATDLVGGQEATICIPPDQIETVMKSEEEWDLGSRIRLIAADGAAKNAIKPKRDGQPAILNNGSVLVLPLEDGEMTVEGLEIGATLRPEQISCLNVLVNLTIGLIHKASALETIAQQSEKKERVNQQLMKKNMALRESTMIDALTGLYNRRFFSRSLSYELERFRRYKHPIGVILFDIDFFKKVNDTHGHNVGDDALCHISRVAKESIRTADLLARYGGEEFVVLLPDTGIEGATTTAERLRANVASQSLTIPDGKLSMTISAGVTAITDDINFTPDEVIRKVDKALYRAKEEGRNRVVVTIFASNDETLTE